MPGDREIEESMIADLAEGRRMLMLLCYLCSNAFAVPDPRKVHLAKLEGEDKLKPICPKCAEDIQQYRMENGLKPFKEWL